MSITTVIYTFTRLDYNEYHDVIYTFTRLEYNNKYHDGSLYFYQTWL